MSDSKITTRITSIANRAEPLLGSVAVGGSSAERGKVWSWGDDNMLPYALSLLARRSVAHRRIINDKADYIAGNAVVCNEQSALLSHLVQCANGSGESLRSVISRIALDNAMFGNAFLEVVTDKRHSFLDRKSVV